MSWKRSRRGTLMVSTSARWMASPTLRRYASGLPLTSEMRTRGMDRLFGRGGALEQPDQRREQDPVDRLGALAARAGLQRLHIGKVDSHGLSFQASDTAAKPLSELTRATPRSRRR